MINPMLVRANLSYREFFDDYDTSRIELFLKEIPKQSALIFVCSQLSQFYWDQLNQGKHIYMLNLWLEKLPEKLQEKVRSHVNDFIKRGFNFNFITHTSSLILIDAIFQYCEDLPPQEELNERQSLDFFKAYLWCSQYWIDKQGKTYSQTEPTEIEGYIASVLPGQLPLFEFVNVKDFRIQFIKAIYFFKFCERNADFAIFLSTFLSEYDLQSWQIYLKNLITPFQTIFSNQIVLTELEISNDYPDVLAFFSQLDIQNRFEKSKDFSSIRKYPVYRYDDNIFLFLNLNFFTDKIYQSIQFEFANVVVKKDLSFQKKKITDRPQFLGIFGEYFSELELFYSVMEYCFGELRYIQSRGNEIKKAIIDGEPDYYLRDKNKIYLFEFKNTVLNYITKYSYDYKQIKAEVFKKLVANEKGLPKGATQLMNTIEKIKAGVFKKLDNYDFDNVVIYPIIVCTDISFNAPGINYILNQEFREKVDQVCSNSSNINDLIIVDFDTLIRHQERFREKKLKINYCFNEYYKFVKKPHWQFKLSSFSDVIRNLQMPKSNNSMFLKEVNNLFKNKMDMPQTGTDSIPTKSPS